MAKMIKRTTAGYVVIQNKIAQDKNLGHYDRGMLVQLLSLPDDWDFSINGLRELTADGRDSIAKSIERLIAAGYIEKNEQPRKGGKFSKGTVWIIYDEPQKRIDTESAPFTEKPLTVKPFTDEPLTENPTQQNKNIQSTKIQSTKSSSGDEREQPAHLQQEMEQALATEADDIRSDVMEAVESVYENLDNPEMCISYRNTMVPVSVVAKALGNISGAQIANVVTKYKSARSQRHIASPVEYIRTLLYAESLVPPQRSPANNFQNFKQRSYDFSALEAEAFNNS